MTAAAAEKCATKRAMSSLAVIDAWFVLRFGDSQTGTGQDWAQKNRRVHPEDVRKHT